MLIRTGRSRRGSFAELEQNQQRITSAAVGREVIVLVAGVYNGPNHKSLGRCDVSTVIRVAVGAYADSLIQDGLVAPYDSSAPVEDDEDLPEAATAPTDPVNLELRLDPNRVDEPVGNVYLEGELHTEPPADPMPWRPFLEAGLTEKVAKLVWDAGFHSADDILGKWAEGGIEGLTAIQGVGGASARKLLVWAGVPAEDLA